MLFVLGKEKRKTVFPTVNNIYILFCACKSKDMTQKSHKVKERKLDCIKKIKLKAKTKRPL